MSRAFVKEVNDQSVLHDRPISPRPNIVTPEGLAAIERSIDCFTAAYKAALNKDDKEAIAAAQRELRYWSARLATAKLIQPSRDSTHLHFGSTVVVRREDGRMQTFRIMRMKPNRPEGRYRTYRLSRVPC
jgi:transcription elongation GreA/GreB family factor